MREELIRNNEREGNNEREMIEVMEGKNGE